MSETKYYLLPLDFVFMGPKGFQNILDLRVVGGGYNRKVPLAHDLQLGERKGKVCVKMLGG